MLAAVRLVDGGDAIVTRCWSGSRACCTRKSSVGTPCQTHLWRHLRAAILTPRGPPSVVNTAALGALPQVESEAQGGVEGGERLAVSRPRKRSIAAGASV